MRKQNDINNINITASAIKAYVAYQRASRRWESAKLELRGLMESESEMLVLSAENGVVKLIPQKGRENFNKDAFKAKYGAEKYQEFVTIGKPSVQFKVSPYNPIKK